MTRNVLHIILSYKFFFTVIIVSALFQLYVKRRLWQCEIKYDQTDGYIFYRQAKFWQIYLMQNECSKIITYNYAVFIS